MAYAIYNYVNNVLNHCGMGTVYLTNYYMICPDSVMPKMILECKRIGRDDARYLIQGLYYMWKNGEN